MGRCRMLRKGSASASNTYSNCTQPMMLQVELWSRWAKWKALRFPAQVPSTAVLRGHGLAARAVLRQRGCGCSRHCTDATTGSGSRRRQLSPVHCLATEVALPVACCLLLLLLLPAAAPAIAAVRLSWFGDKFLFLPLPGKHLVFPAQRLGHQK